ncbi:hypothetical protein CEXT_442461 [Caerostris extrusa]|uniref:Uncharacterized protein n=1 Tax=Caerostris extrusa TaxID=172846 RepID=A0AAV4WXW3_CAEEX|nr:hypothetical protein CEXT_442461 [Caerostris extrusa]
MDGVAAYRVRFRCNSDSNTMSASIRPWPSSSAIKKPSFSHKRPGERTFANEPRNDAAFCKVVHSGRCFVLPRNRPVVDSPAFL